VVRGDLGDRTVEFVLDTLTEIERRVKASECAELVGHDAAGPGPVGGCGRCPLVWPRILSRSAM
jgi:hypothetical protein